MLFTLLVVLFVLQWASCIIATYNITKKILHLDMTAPDFTIVRPFSGVDYGAATNIYSAINLSYPGKVKHIFCLESASDEALDDIRACTSLLNKDELQILFGKANYKNPKLANVAKGVAKIDTEFTAMIDSNVVLNKKYLQDAVATYYNDAKIGLVSAPVLVSDSQSFWASIEGSIFNTFQLRWQYATDFFGYAFAQGKNLIYKTEMLKMVGGLSALDHVAEDACFTKEIRKLGMRVALMPPSRMFLGKRSFTDFWNRQVRWARYRRKTFSWQFFLELFTGITPVLLLAFLMHLQPFYILVLIASFYLPEWLFSYFLNLDTCPFFIIKNLIKDLLMNGVWLSAWGNNIEWRGNKIDLANL